jgi:ammonium transporter, Amt family
MAMTDLAQVLCGMLVLLAPLAGAGLALMNSGLGRSRSAAHAMLAPLCVMAVAVLVYCVCGWSWQSFPGGRPTPSPWRGLVELDAAEPFFLRGLRSMARPPRWRLAADVQRGAGGVDSAGRGERALALGAELRVHRHSGRLDLPFIRALGVGRGMAGATGRAGRRRRGHHSGGGWPHRAGGRRNPGAAPWEVRFRRHSRGFPGHNAVLVLFGCFLTWMGWMGLNGAGSLLFAGATAGASSASP